MLAPFQFADGDATSPGAAWAQETNTGLYRFGPGDLRVSVTGVDLFRWNSGAASVWDAANTTWQSVVTQGGTATTGDLLVFDETGPGWQATDNPGGLLPVGDADMRGLLWDTSTNEWIAVSSAPAGKGSAEFQTLSWVTGLGAWGATDALQSNITDSTVGVDMLPSIAGDGFPVALSVKNGMWVGPDNGIDAGLTIWRLGTDLGGDSTILFEAGIKDLPLTPTGSFVFNGKAVALKAAGAVGGDVILNSVASEIRMQNNGTDALVVESTGVLQSLPTSLNDLTGQPHVLVNASGQFGYEASVAASKVNIRNYDLGLKTVDQLNPVLFNSIYDPDGRAMAGFIAEDLEELGLDEFLTRDAEGNLKGVDYGRITALLVNAVNELRRMYLT